MTDRELLELAAKAAGLNVVTWSNCQPGGFLARESEDESGKFWNPLTDDGDALRLAIKLGIKINPYPIYERPKHSVIASRLEMTERGAHGPDEIKLYGNDPLAATRRVIVSVAAEIGKQEQS